MEEVASDPGHCLVTCTGLYADIEHIKDDLDMTSNSKGIQLLLSVFDLYKTHKDSYVKNIVFDPASESLSKYSQNYYWSGCCKTLPNGLCKHSEMGGQHSSDYKQNHFTFGLLRYQKTLAMV